MGKQCRSSNLNLRYCLLIKTASILFQFIKKILSKKYSFRFFVSMFKENGKTVGKVLYQAQTSEEN